MMRKATWMALAASLAFLLSSASAWAGTDPARLARGAKLYGDNCNRCHNARPAAEHRDRDWDMAMQHMRIIAMLPGDQARDILYFLKATNDPPREVGP